MTRYQTYQLGALFLVGIAASQLISTAAAIFNPSVGFAVFIPILLGLVGWVSLESAKFLKVQENPELPAIESNLPFALLILVLVIIGGIMGVLWTD